MKMKCGMKERKQIESRIINENNGHGNDNTTKYPVGATKVYFFHSSLLLLFFPVRKFIILSLV